MGAVGPRSSFRGEVGIERTSLWLHASVTTLHVLSHSRIARQGCLRMCKAALHTRLDLDRPTQCKIDCSGALNVAAVESSGA